MRYDFDSMQPIQGKVIFALALDKRKNKERIVVGLEDEVKKLLQNENGDAYFDRTSPLGQLLFDFESESADDWIDKCISEMIQSYRKAFLRAKNTRPVKVFLQRKCDTNSVCNYVAIQVWNWYLTYLNENQGTTKLNVKTSSLFKPFNHDSTKRLWELNYEELSASNDDLKLEIWYPNKAIELECVIVRDSLYPLIYYYMKRFEEWNLYFRKCKVCDKYFVATNRKYELCGKKCRSIQNTQNKRVHDEKLRQEPSIVKYETEYGYWNYRMNKLCKELGDDSELLKSAEAVFVKFKVENKQWKSDVINEVKTNKEYTYWLLKQRDVIDDLMDTSF